MEVSGVPSLCGSWSTVGQQLGGVLGGTAWGMCCRRALWLAVTWFDVLVVFPLEWGSGRLKWGWLTILVFYVSRIGIVLSWFSLTTTVGYLWGGDRFVATVWGEKKKSWLYRIVLFKYFFAALAILHRLSLVLWEWLLRKRPIACHPQFRIYFCCFPLWLISYCLLVRMCLFMYCLFSFSLMEVLDALLILWWQWLVRSQSLVFLGWKLLHGTLFITGWMLWKVITDLFYLLLVSDLPNYSIPRFSAASFSLRCKGMKGLPALEPGDLSRPFHPKPFVYNARPLPMIHKVLSLTIFIFW